MIVNDWYVLIIDISVKIDTCRSILTVFDNTDGQYGINRYSEGHFIYIFLE